MDVVEADAEAIEYPIYYGYKKNKKWERYETEILSISPQEIIELVESGFIYRPHYFWNLGLDFGSVLPHIPHSYYYTSYSLFTGDFIKSPARIVLGKGGEIYFSPDHYRTFYRVV